MLRLLITKLRCLVRVWDWLLTVLSGRCWMLLVQIVPTLSIKWMVHDLSGMQRDLCRSGATWTSLGMNWFTNCPWACLDVLWSVLGCLRIVHAESSCPCWRDSAVRGSWSPWLSKLVWHKLAHLCLLINLIMWLDLLLLDASSAYLVRILSIDICIFLSKGKLSLIFTLLLEILDSIVLV